MCSPGSRAFTGGCTAECKSIKENGDAIRKFDVAYFTASTDAVEASPADKGNKAFAESLNVDYPDSQRSRRQSGESIRRAERSRNRRERVTFYIGKDGKILFVDKVDKNGGGR